MSAQEDALFGIDKLTPSPMSIIRRGCRPFVSTPC
jgi:hypothetical protein